MAISALSKPALRFWDGLLQQVGLPSPFTRKGLLYAYGSPRSFAAALRDNVYRTRRGIAFEILDGPAARVLEPALAPSLAGAIYAPEAAHHPWPQTLSDQLFERFRARGGHFVQGAVQRAREGCQVRVRGLGDQPIADQLFLCAGAYGATLAKQLGWAVPLAAGRATTSCTRTQALRSRERCCSPARLCGNAHGRGLTGGNRGAGLPRARSRTAPRS